MTEAAVAAAPPAPAASVDVRALPSYGFGACSLMWWGTLGLMLIEGTAFGLAIAMYFFVRTLAAAWPIDAAMPDPVWGTLNTLLLLASLWPNQMAKRAAEARNRPRARFWLCICLLAALAFLVVRALEFGALNVSWHASAYGSVVWLLMGLHTTHLITDTADTAVLAVLLFSGPFDARRFVDVSENAWYWYFVVATWLPIYAVVYWAPRF
ncbi:cytochrome c oxidase subunit 3 [Variovorax soli]|uniref:Heme/copper-type cytochrome/quinol oxidase subunit 3 n=1 Tax=Variovorax soli TaxID=376815 RepID=A0ABU1NDL8_9BURK|nr:cytochrome c oxidase subunit 3 [Variovorax soli]MDR6536560.1 heme/copper-type cytochrome/quinol oxidase subunit 3 [Variovorax soli]